LTIEINLQIGQKPKRLQLIVVFAYSDVSQLPIFYINKISKHVKLNYYQVMYYPIE